MLTLLFGIWLLSVTFRMAVFAIRAGWGILRILLMVVFLPLMIVGLLIGGLIQLSVPILVIIGIVTLVRSFARRDAL